MELQRATFPDWSELDFVYEPADAAKPDVRIREQVLGEVVWIEDDLGRHEPHGFEEAMGWSLPSDPDRPPGQLSVCWRGVRLAA